MEILNSVNWLTLVPLVIALTGALKDLGAFKKMSNQLVNLIVGASIILLMVLANAVGFNWINITPITAIAVLVFNPLVYDKIVKPTLEFLKAK